MVESSSDSDVEDPSQVGRARGLPPADLVLAHIDRVKRGNSQLEQLTLPRVAETEIPRQVELHIENVDSTSDRVGAKQV